jgi:DNA repair protein RadC
MLIQPEYRGQRQEMTKVILLDSRNRVLKIETVFVGTLNFSVLHPREIFQVALRHNAASIILTHNHPSGEAEPSPEDIQATQQIADAGKLIDIPLLDHVIIGDGCYTSLKEKGVL